MMKRHRRPPPAHHRPHALLTVLGGAALLLWGCESDLTGPLAVGIQTTQAEYELDEIGGWHFLTVHSTITNAGTRPIDLHRFCGHTDGPASLVTRPDGYDVPIGFIGWGCFAVESDMQPPIPLAPGESYIDVAELTADRANDVREWTGAFRLLYYVQSSDRTASFGTDLIPEADRVSNTFVVLRPAIPYPPLDPSMDDGP